MKADKTRKSIEPPNEPEHGTIEHRHFRPYTLHLDKTAAYAYCVAYFLNIHKEMCHGITEGNQSAIRY